MASCRNIAGPQIHGPFRRPADQRRLAFIGREQGDPGQDEPNGDGQAENQDGDHEASKIQLLAMAKGMPVIGRAVGAMYAAAPDFVAAMAKLPVRAA
jgi:hypothetical protein